MARAIADIKTSIVTAVASDSNLSALTSTSNVADWNLWAYIVAVAMWTIEKLFDAHVAEVQGILTTQKPHTLQWYATMAKAFQYGAALPADSDTYDNTGLTADQVATMQVVSYASATETGTGIRIKAAALSGSSLAKLSDTQLTAFTAYMAKVKDAGIRLNVTSTDPDTFYSTLTIFYDPLVLDASGQRLDGTSNTPVQDAITTFLDNLPFNGVLIYNNYIAALQAVDGVVIAEVQDASANYGNLQQVSVDPQYLPDAGYLAIDLSTDLNITFTAYGTI
jgi:hypothetical protein